LRGARLYDGDALVDLWASAATSGSAFHIELKLFKWVTDWKSEELQKAPTWAAGGTGMHSGDGDCILDIITQLTDRFIDDSLRVNAEAC